MADSSSDLRRQVKTHLKGRKVLVVDDSSSCRANIAKVLKDFGADDVILSNTFEQASSLMSDTYLDVLIADYHLGQRCGLDLIIQARKDHIEPSKLLTVVITSNSSESVVAEAAEEDVDAYILKPFTFDSLQNGLFKAIIRKVRPSKYRRLIQQGKDLLQETRAEEAAKIFYQARALSEKPALACYYQGESEEILQHIPKAETCFKEGLSYNSIHYRCLTGLFDLYLKARRKVEAYAQVEKIATYFPISPKRLGIVLQLAVETGHFDHIDHYYDIFISLNHREEKLVRYVSAALVVAGMFRLKQGEKKTAIEMFNKASSAAQRKPIILREIIEILVRNKKPRSAEEFLKQFKPEDQECKDYEAMKFLVYSRIEEPGITIDKGRKLIKAGIIDPKIYEGLILASIAGGIMESAESTAYDGSLKFPKLKDYFFSLLKPADPPS